MRNFGFCLGPRSPFGPRSLFGPPVTVWAPRQCLGPRSPFGPPVTVMNIPDNNRTIATQPHKSTVTTVSSNTTILMYNHGLTIIVRTFWRSAQQYDYNCIENQLHYKVNLHKELNALNWLRPQIRLSKVPHCRTARYEQKSFAISGPTLRNTLPPTTHDPSLTLTQFCVLMKTYDWCGSGGALLRWSQSTKLTYVWPG